MHIASLVVSAVVLLASSLPSAPAVRASGPLPLVARLEKVTVEAAGETATLVIDGRYLVRNGVQKPFIAAGRIHYTCAKGELAQCLLAWTDLLKAASSDKCVTWGQRGDKLPTPALPYAQLGQPTPWKVGVGVVALNAARCAEIDKPLEAP